jgi:hypothetical protein
MSRRPFLRRGPSGPLALDGIIQLAFDQCIFSDPEGEQSWIVQNDLNNPLDPAEIAAQAHIARDVSLQNGGPPGNPSDVPTSNRMGALLKDVQPGSLIGAWYSFGFSSAQEGFLLTTALAVEDPDGNQALVGFSNQNLLEPGTPAGTVGTGSAITFGENPLDAVADIIVYPVAFTLDLSVAVFPALNQVSVLAAEIAQTP